MYSFTVFVKITKNLKSARKLSYSIHMPADALKDFNGFKSLYKIFPDVSDVPSMLSSHTPDTWLAVSS